MIWRHNPVVLESKRLIIKEVSLSHSKDMYEYSQNPLVAYLAGWEKHENINWTKRVIKLMLSKKEYGGLPPFAIILKKTGKMIGTVEIYGNELSYKATIGYTINPSYWSNSYATEAAFRIIEYGFSKLKLKRIECTTYVENRASQRVCEKLRLTKEGLLRKGYRLYDGSLHDIFLYSIIDDEYYSREYQLYKQNFNTNLKEEK